MDLLEKNNEEKFEDSEFEKTEMNEDLEREKNEEAAKDILIEELEEENTIQTNSSNNKTNTKNKRS